MIVHKKLVYILLLGFLLMSSVAFLLVFWPEPVAELTYTVSSNTNTEKPILGKPCSYKGESKLETNGLQCYFYGDSISNKQGIWLKLDSESKLTIGNDLLSKPITWQEYNNPKLGVAFPIPAATEFKAIDLSDEKDYTEVNIEYNNQALFSVARYTNKPVSALQRLEQEKEKGSTSMDNEVTLGASKVPARQIVIFPKTNLSSPVLIWVIDRTDFYYYIKTNLHNNSVLRYISEYMAQNMVVAEAPPAVTSPSTGPTTNTATSLIKPPTNN